MTTARWTMVVCRPGHLDHYVADGLASDGRPVLHPLTPGMGDRPAAKVWPSFSEAQAFEFTVTTAYPSCYCKTIKEPTR